jgi:predicted ATPase
MRTIIQQLEDEKNALEARVRAVDAALAALGDGSAPVKTRGRRRMTTAEREAVSKRMKKSWAKRKKQMGANKK